MEEGSGQAFGGHPGHHLPWGKGEGGPDPLALAGGPSIYEQRPPPGLGGQWEGGCRHPTPDTRPDTHAHMHTNTPLRSWPTKGFVPEKILSPVQKKRATAGGCVCRNHCPPISHQLGQGTEGRGEGKEDTRSGQKNLIVKMGFPTHPNTRAHIHGKLGASNQPAETEKINKQTFTPVL